jgi:hypothetical protein
MDDIARSYERAIKILLDAEVPARERLRVAIRQRSRLLDGQSETGVTVNNS